MKSITLHPAARAEALAVAEYYDTCCPGLGREFTDSIERALAGISARPQSFGVYESTGARRCVRQRFPYSIFFLEREEGVWVLAIAHAARKPGYWEDRI